MNEQHVNEEQEPLIPANQERRKQGPEYPADYVEKFNDAMEQEQQRVDRQEVDDKKIGTLRKSIFEDTKNRAFDSITAPKEQAIFKPNFQKPEGGSWFKRWALPRLVALVGLLPAKEALGQKQMNSDKVQPGTEKVITQDFELSKDTKEAWEGYREFVKGKGLLNDPRLKTRAFSDKLMEEYSEVSGVKFNEDTVKEVQRFFLGYRKWLKDRVAKGKAVFDNSKDDEDFFAELSKVDGIAGPLTLAHFFPDNVNEYITELKMKGPKINGADTWLTFKKDTVKKIEGYVDTSEQ